MADRKDRPWLDVLNRKHECGPSYASFLRIEFEDRGEPVVMAIPDELVQVRRLSLRGFIRSGPLATLLAWHDMEGESDPYERGIAMIARLEDGIFVTHVWHELYPWAIQHLGLSDALVSFRWIDEPREDDEDIEDEDD